MTVGRDPLVAPPGREQRLAETVPHVRRSREHVGVQAEDGDCPFDVPTSQQPVSEIVQIRLRGAEPVHGLCDPLRQDAGRLVDVPRQGGGFDPRGQSKSAFDADGDGDTDAADTFEYMTFEPEKVTSFELGWKASLLDKRVFTSLALFRANYKDMQIPASEPCIDANGTATFCGLTSNAGKARIQGVEWEGDARLFGNPGGPRLNFSWSLGYLDAKFRQFIVPMVVGEDLLPFPDGAHDVDIADFRKIQNTPKWTASGTLQ